LPKHSHDTGSKLIAAWTTGSSTPTTDDEHDRQEHQRQQRKRDIHVYVIARVAIYVKGRLVNLVV